MATTELSSVETSVQVSNTQKVRDGLIGGIAGGVVFGLMMTIMGSLPMVGMLVGVQNAAVGVIVHMAISAFIGVTFGLLLDRFTHNVGGALSWGAIYGMVWWVLGALILMPAMLGMTDMVLKVGQAQWMSLMGHVIFGLVLGGVYYGSRRVLG